jgi:hypothetical protein
MHVKMAKMNACRVAISVTSNRKMATPKGSVNQARTSSPSSTARPPAMNWMSMWPASRLANSRTVSEISRRKCESTSSGKIMIRIGPLTPGGIMLFV